MRNLCLLMKKVGMQCTYDDAQVLAQYEGLTATTNGYAKRLKARMPEWTKTKNKCSYKASHY
jgi:hypothetical protein